SLVGDEAGWTERSAGSGGGVDVGLFAPARVVEDRHVVVIEQHRVRAVDVAGAGEGRIRRPSHVELVGVEVRPLHLAGENHPRCSTTVDGLATFLPAKWLLQRAMPVLEQVVRITTG